MNEPVPSLGFILRVLSLVAENDDCGELYWRTDGSYAPVTFFINCNDLFWWGTGDCEPLTSNNVGLLEASYRDAKAASPEKGRICATSLFCCRARKMRPQGACYPKDTVLWPLFDACGPEREIGLGNPHPPGGKTRKEAAP